MEYPVKHYFCIVPSFFLARNTFELTGKFSGVPHKNEGKLVAGVESVLQGILHTHGRSTASTAGFTEITNDNKKTTSIDRW